MFIKIFSFVILFLLGFVHSSPVENPPNSETQTDTASNGKSVATAKREQAKFAAPLADQDYARHHTKLIPILQKLPSLMQYKPSFVQPFEHFQPAPVKPVAPIYQPVPFISESVYSKPSIQSMFTKPSIPISPESVYTKPSQYAISSQIIHRPVLTDKVEIIRRPVVSEVLEAIHKPSLTEEQQVIKIPNYVAHVVQKPVFNSIKNEFQGHPIVLPTQHYSHLDKLQYLPPVTTEVVQVPHQHITSHGSIECGSIHGAESPLKPNILGSLGLGGIGTGYGVGSAAPSYNFGSYYGSGSASPSYFGSSHGVGSSIPSYVGSSHGVGSSVPSYLGSGYGIGSAVPSYVGSGYGIGSSIPSYVGSSHGVGSSVPSYLGSGYGIGSAVPSYVGSGYGIGSTTQSYVGSGYGIGSGLHNVGISSSPLYGGSGAGYVTSAGHGGESEGVVNTYIEPAPSCKSDDCKLTTTDQYLAPEYSLPMTYTPTMWYGTQASPEYLISVPSPLGKSNEGEGEEQPEVYYVPHSPAMVEQPDSRPSSMMASTFLSNPEINEQLRGMIEKFINNGAAAAVDSRKVGEEKLLKGKSNSVDVDSQNKKPAEEKVKGKSNSEDDTQDERKSMSRVDEVRKSLRTMSQEQLGEIEEAVHEFKRDVVKKNDGASNVQTVTSQAIVQESSPRAA